MKQTYCAQDGPQQVKITNLPADSDGIAIQILLDDSTALNLRSDSSFMFAPGALTVGDHTLKISYTGKPGSSSLSLRFTIEAAVTPIVDLTANITNIINLTEPVVLTATNTEGGGATPLFTFATDRAFQHIIQPESAANTIELVTSDLHVGENWIYVRMKTSENCARTQTAVDSVQLMRDAATGIIDVDYPNTVIKAYPNPFKNKLRLTGLSNLKTYSVMITNLHGQVIYRRQVVNQIDLDIDNAVPATGTWLLRLYDVRKGLLIGTIKIVRK